MFFKTYMGDCLAEVEAKISRNHRAKIISMTINGLEFDIDDLSAKALAKLEDEADEKALEVEE
jgi:hypothetical protein